MFVEVSDFLFTINYPNKFVLMLRCVLLAAVARAADICRGLRDDVVIPQGEALKLRVTTHQNALSPYELVSMSQKSVRKNGKCDRPVPRDVLLAVGGVPVYNGSLSQAVATNMGPFAFPLVEQGLVKGFMIVTTEKIDLPLTFAVGKGARAREIDIGDEIMRRQQLSHFSLGRKSEAPSAELPIHENIASKQTAEYEKIDARTAQPPKQQRRQSSENRQPPRGNVVKMQTLAPTDDSGDDPLSLVKEWAESQDEPYELVRVTFADDKKGPTGISFDAGQVFTVVSSVERGRPAAKAGVKVGDRLVEMRWIERDDDGEQSNRIINSTTLKASQVRVALKDASFPRTFVFYRRKGKQLQSDENDEMMKREKEEEMILRIMSPEILQGTQVATLPASWASSRSLESPCDHHAVLILADPADACSPGPLATSQYDTSQIYALASRGKCSFVDKARVLEQSGANATIVYNNVPGLVDMPKGGSRTDDILGPVVMIENDVGLLLSRVLRWKNSTVTVWLGPRSRCGHTTLEKPPTARKENVVTQGTLHIQYQNRSIHFDHIAASFGPFAAEDIPLAVAIASPPELCTLSGVDRRLVSQN